MVRLRARAGQRREGGAVTIIVALLMTVLLVMAALVVDLGMARDLRRVSQNASDASALAGANTLYPKSGACQVGLQPCITDAVAAVKKYATLNLNIAAGDWATCANADKLAYVPPGESSCISFDSPSAPTRIAVQMPTRTVVSLFGRAAGRSSIPVSSVAQAIVGKDFACGLCFMGDVDGENSDYTVVGGSIAVNGSVKVGPNSVWTATSNYVVDGVSGGKFFPAAADIPSFPDPLASLALPLGTTGLTAKTNPCSSGPGIYSAAFEFPNNSSCTLLPGLYVVKNTWSMKHNTVVTAPGVTLYVPNPGALDFKNGLIVLSAPLSGPTKGLAIVYDRDNTNDIGLQGNGVTSITGKVYALSGRLAFNGTSDFVFTGGPVVVNGVVKANGNQGNVKVVSTGDVPFAKANPGLDQ